MAAFITSVGRVQRQDGPRTAGQKTKLKEKEARLAEIDAKLAAPAPSRVRLHPQLSDIYRRKVGELSRTLADPEIRLMALETMRGLIKCVTMHERSERVQIDLAGAITALVGLAQPRADAIFRVGSVKLVAGGRIDLDRTAEEFGIGSGKSKLQL